MRQDTTILEATINAPIDADTFVIEPEVGTEIQETYNDRPTRIWMHVGDKTLSEVRRDLVQAAKRTGVDATQDQVDAPPQPTSLAMYGWIVTLVIVGAIVALTLIMRRA